MWQKTARGRMVYKEDLAKANKADEFVARKLLAAPSFARLLAAAKRFYNRLHGKDNAAGRMAQFDRQPWEVLTTHAGVMNAKSATAKTLRQLTDAVFAETGLPRDPPGKFRGEDGLNWDGVLAMV
jgi:hypothetical protein